MPLPTKSIKGLEIFATGRHNGDVYSEGDLDDMVNAFGEVFCTRREGRASKRSGEFPRGRCCFRRACTGYVSRIWRKGQKLLADISGIPARFADLISAGSYKRVSSEIYWNYETQDAIYPRVLKAIAFLGADIPALTSLRAVESLFQRAPSAFAYGSGREVRVYSFQNVKGGHMPLKTYAHEGDLLEDYRRYTSHDCDRAASEKIKLRSTRVRVRKSLPISPRNTSAVHLRRWLKHVAVPRRQARLRFFKRAWPWIATPGRSCSKNL